MLCFRIKFSYCDNSFDLSEMLPRPRTPSPSACCGNGCSPCVMDLHDQVGFIFVFVCCICTMYMYSHFRNYAPPLDVKGGIIMEKFSQYFLRVFFFTCFGLVMYI